MFKLLSSDVYGTLINTPPTNAKAYPDALRTLEKLAGKHRLAVVSNIDDDLLQATPLHRDFDLLARSSGPVVTSLTARCFDTLRTQLSGCRNSCIPTRRSSPTWWVASRSESCWISRRSIDLDPSVPPPDHIFFRHPVVTAAAGAMMNPGFRGWRGPDKSYRGTGPIVSAILAPRAPRGFDGPTVVSRVV